MVSALAAVPASAQETMELVVRPGDTCELIAERLYGAPSQYVRIHEHNPSLGPTPHHLAPGTVLRVPVPEPLARLSAVHRTVEHRRPEAARSPASRGLHTYANGAD